MRRPNSPVQLFSHENYMLKMQYNELLHKYNRLHHEYEELKHRCSEHRPSDNINTVHAKTIQFLQNKNTELNKVIIDKNKHMSIAVKSSNQVEGNQGTGQGIGQGTGQGTGQEPQQRSIPFHIYTLDSPHHSPTHSRPHSPPHSPLHSDSDSENEYRNNHSRF